MILHLFFLTATATGTKLRFTAAANNVAGNTLPKEPFFIHQIRQSFKDRINKGKVFYAGEYLYSSSYDEGEMWATNDIPYGVPGSVGFANLFVEPSGPAANFRIAVAGVSPNGSSPRDRRYSVELNNTKILDTTLNQFEAKINSVPSVPLSIISGTNTAIFKINNLSIPAAPIATDRIVCSFLELNYARQFNFGAQTNFPFTLSASATGKYLEIANFNAGNAVPVLYDLTNSRRYVANVSGALVRFVLPPSSAATNFVLVSQDADAGHVKTVTGIQQRNFVNYAASANQGNYLIISHPALMVNFSGANQVEEYKAYRSTAAGGNYNAKVYDIDQLVDQFGYGIKKNPLGVKNFLRFARTNFSSPIEFAFIIGKGLTYADYRENESSGQADRLNLVPTWGYPASDILLASNNMEPVMSTLIGRISVISPKEVAEYLDKVKQYEQAQQSLVNTIEGKAWMKNVVHVVGANDLNLSRLLTAYMNNYQGIIEQPFFTAKVYNFNKESTGPVTPIVNTQMNNLFQTGISLLSYFGHSSATSLDYNLDDPSAYNNTGKYPMFLVSGCNAGNLYSFDPGRFSIFGTLSEKFVLAKNKGSIGFIASTHFGIDTYLDHYNKAFYRSVTTTGYGRSITYNMSEANNAMIAAYGTVSLGGRMHAEQTTLHGDPAIRMNTFAKPDYVVEEPQVQVTPNVLSVADAKFTLNVKAFNIGKASTDSVLLEVRQRYANGTEAIIYSQKMKPIRVFESVNIDVPIVALRDKGQNQLIVTIDPLNALDELSETNNSITKNITIFEDELTPVYPANFGIVNKLTTKLMANTANPVVDSRQYLMEMDTTEHFNSSFKISKNIISTGGLIEFDPGISFTDSTVYYWRVAPFSATALRWKNSSFVYLAGSSLGYNQSHFYQHTKSKGTGIYIDSSSRKWTFDTNQNTITIVNAVFGPGLSGTGDNDFSIAVNGTINNIASACVGSSVIFNVFDPFTLAPFFNQAQPSTTRSGVAGGFMGSGPVCGTTKQYNFEFSFMDTSGRRRMKDFMDWVPAGYYVTARLIIDPKETATPFVNTWKNDAAVYGAGNTAYNRFISAGFTDFDNYTTPRTWSFIYRKNRPSFQPLSMMSNGFLDKITMNVSINTPITVGTIASPAFGPAKTWKNVKWRGSSIENNAKDVYSVQVIGLTPTGVEDTLFRLQPTQQDFDISSVNAVQYPYIKLAMKNQELDSAALTPYQLRYWRLIYEPLPEGAIAPNLAGAPISDTLEKGEPLTIVVPFKNISDVAFTDSLTVDFSYDSSGTTIRIPVGKKKILQPGDTTNLSYTFNTKNLTGANAFSVDFNPAPSQPEQFRFNNYLTKNFFLRDDSYNPLMDITFDGVHILNGDIVSAKPKIVIKLKDESKFLSLDDTALTTVYIKYPGVDGALVRYGYNNDTLRFIPADLSSGKNEAMIEFTPAFLQDSESGSYELIVKGRDKSGNPAGITEYHVTFQVYTKPMITNMFNYPNPFTSSTAFVFTLTGSDVPQNLRIQILTITGKIVKEITKQELGPLRIGRNITEYKWDGTDQYGGMLANGVYLYRVITNLNGASLEKFSTLDANREKVNTDKYFNKGYGKMYLMR